MTLVLWEVGVIDKQKMFEVKLIGFFDNVIYIEKITAENKTHAVKIASALFNKCWKNAVVTEMPEIEKQPNYIKALYLRLTLVVLRTELFMVRLWRGFLS